MTHDIVERLRKSHLSYSMQIILIESADEIERLRAQRDDARREVCEWVALQTKRTSREVERIRGWDCFEGVDDGNP